MIAWQPGMQKMPRQRQFASPQAWEDALERWVKEYQDVLWRETIRPMADRFNNYYVSTEDVSVVNTAAATSLLTGAAEGSLTVPAGWLTPGRSIWIQLRGTYRTDTVAPTLRLRVLLGTTALLDSGALNMTVSTTGRIFYVDGLVTCRTQGASGTAYGEGHALFSTGDLTADHYQMGVAVVPITWDTTTAKALDVTVTWGTAHLNNSITVTNAFVYFLGQEDDRV